MGLVKKEKLVEKESRKGRPSYLYKVDVSELYEKIVGDWRSSGGHEDTAESALQARRHDGN